MQRSYEQPREKLRRRGSGTLTTTELLQAIIGTGTSQSPVEKVARQIAKHLDEPDRVTLEELATVRGIGGAKAVQLVAVLELGKRLYRTPVRSPYVKALSNATIDRCVYRVSDKMGGLVDQGVVDLTYVHTAVRQLIAKLIAPHASRLEVEYIQFESGELHVHILEMARIVTHVAKWLEISLKSEKFIVNGKMVRV